MKTMNFKYFYIIIAVFFSSISVAQSYEVIDGDTINVVDANGLKQGFWRIFGRMKKLPGYQPDQVVEEGNYKDSKKQGIWKRFFPNGKVKDEIEYVNNRPNGYYRTYYENGQVQEEGVWQRNRNVGQFKRYYENGQVAQEFNFNETGKRDGKQVYYYENGQVMIEGEWAAGKESGEIVEYYENGDIKAKKVFNNGIMDTTKSQIFEPKNPIENKEDEELADAPEKVVKVEADEKPNVGKFDGNGPFKLYNKNKQIVKDGVFKNYRLMDGKWYKYTDDGILYNIEVYKKGKYIGDAPLPE